ncbi:PTS system N-acetylglucosamine-specific IIC component [Hypnocyclicus thermotrophus]|uniref:PTS system N-acetylglucosamine-specific IIC component n=1 Tax=Hypnocyclicus thermotrophus TaxID=1627895 RepID=A0AA46DYU1_9FUSO|nr:N-acetylglucosamine-specific PTS transporter subunit IIBC [Hypnocyclicus thermotrophus]TDT70559.1 PTS system N-acetylglucosamine-specific IIC component [Hypnocyclicus thermotrophus]
MKVFSKFQALGKALMMPIAVMPIAAILLRLGVLWNMPFVTSAGGAIFENLPILFAIGVAIGLAKDNAGAAGLAGVVGNFVILNGAQAINKNINMGVFSGIIAGLVAAYMYNKYHKIELPEFLGFFGGRRFVPIITSLACIVLAAVFGYVWPSIQNGLDTVARWMMGTGSIGLFSFGVLNRLLIPTGLHHIINSMAWFTFGSFDYLKDGVQVVANGDLHRFFAGDPNAGIFMTGFFPIMMFGLPAAALAMYTTAKKENKKRVAGVLFSVAFTAFLTGVTEPIEFMFMFLAPGLYLIHAILTGISMALTAAMGIRHGFGFSAGAIDYFLNMNLATKGWLLIPVGLVFGLVYYFIFVFTIKAFDLATPGREDDMEDIEEERGTSSNLSRKVLEALGGKENLTSVDSCITRLRLEVKNQDIINENELKRLGAKGVLKPSATSVQVIFGAKAEIIAQEIRKM